MKRTISAILALFALALLAGCGGGHGSSGLSAEHHTQEGIENNYAKGQPVPALTNSQVRQNLIEIEEAIAEGVSTTSFFFNLGVQDPVKTCPSIGVPIPASSELTNPEQVIKEGEHDNGSTYVLCIEAKCQSFLPDKYRGKPYVSYWEGFVLSEFAPAKWNTSTHTVELLGSSSWEFSKHTPPSGTTNKPEP